MCVLCEGAMVIVTGIGNIRGWQLAPCPLCAIPELPVDHPDYHPGQSLTIGWDQGGAGDVRRTAK
jgi:hypothetical protein